MNDNLSLFIRYFFIYCHLRDILNFRRRANQLTGFFMMATLLFNELIKTLADYLDLYLTGPVLSTTSRECLDS